MKQTEIATLGGGCFWCVEAVYQRVGGVLSVKPGYAGGHVKNPSYKEICTGQPGHADVKAALAEGLAKCNKAGKPAGILTAAEADSIHWLKEGYIFVAVGTDTAILARGADALLARIKEGAA